MKTQQVVWDYETGVPGMVRHSASGRYYSRFQLNGKRTMKALKTDVHSVAKVRHLQVLRDNELARQSAGRIEAGEGRMGDLCAEALKKHGENSALSAKAKLGFSTSIKRLLEQWPKCFGTDLSAMKPGRVTRDHAVDFSNYLHARAEWRRHNTTRTRKGYGAITVNKTLEALHRVLRLAKEKGLLHELPFALNKSLGQEPIRKPETMRKPEFPYREKIPAVFQSMREIPTNLPENQIELRDYLVARAQESADLAEFMAYSGARLKEAATWRWEDERADLIILHGTKTETSKGREVPKIAAMRDLLQRMKARRLGEGRPISGRAFLIGQCREALASACGRVGVPRWTHHSLRHLFTTLCVEAGVDIPTVSRWLGHADGGALLMKRYNHLRQEHSAAQAAKVSFGGGR